MGPAVVGLVLALLATQASAQNATTSNGTSTCQADALNMHNWLRGIHQAGNLTWSAKLASDAQAWADQMAASNCAVQYASITDGENVISLEPNAAINPCYAAPARWYMNGATWNYSTTPSIDNIALLQPQAVDGLARAFTQVVWASTTLIGCAASSGSGGCWSVVCRYQQTGIQALGVVNAASGLPLGATDATLAANVKAPVAPLNLSAAGECDQANLAVVNAHRAAHQSPSMNWDARLAIGAQAWANVVAKQNCQPVRIGRTQGETGLTGNNQFDCAAAPNRLYKDIVRYNFTNTPWTDNQNQLSKIRPFLNMVIATNTKMGCGLALNNASACFVFHCWYGDDMGQYNDTYLLANVKPLQPPVLSSEQQARQNAVLARNNQYRAAHGAPPLTWSDQYTAGLEALLYKPQIEVGNDTTGIIWVYEPGLLVFQANASDATNDTILTLAMDSWYATGNTTYKFTPTPYADNAAQLNKDPGEMLTFAQLLWVSSQTVGCAAKLDGIWYAVCKYGPVGANVPQDSVYLQNVLPLGGVQVSSQPDQSSSSKPVGLIVGLCVGLGVPLLAAVIGLFLWARHRRQQQKDKQADDVWDSFASPKEKALSLGVPDTTMTGVTGTSGLNSCTVIISPGTQHSGAQGVATVMAIPGLTAGEAFTRATAFAYSWTDTYTPVPGVTQAVESGVHDVQLDARVQASGGVVQECPVLSLSKEEVQQQLQLLTGGLLGRGGAALVFKALWPSRFGPDALVAVKVLKEGFDCNPYILQSFAHEASVLASVRHPNVVRLYGYCLEPPNVCLIMELLPGSLKQVLYGTKGGANTTAGLALSGTSLHTTSSHANARAEADTAAPAKPPGSSLQPAGPSTTAVPLTMAQVLKYSTDIAAGLAYLHDQPEQPLTLGDGQTAAPLETLAEAGSGTVAEQPSAGTTSKIVHRDLKPANILINSRDVAKITDFGLARRHDNTTIETRHVGAGTVPYQAPEVLSGAQAGMYGLKATNRCDIYSMAMIMWELLAKQPPWNGMNEMAILGAVVHGRRPELPPPQKAGAVDDAAVDVAQLPASPTALPAFNDIIRQCWAQRDMRRPTAGELHNMLVALQQRHVATPAANA